MRGVGSKVLSFMSITFFHGHGQPARASILRERELLSRRMATRRNARLDDMFPPYLEAHGAEPTCFYSRYFGRHMEDRASFIYCDVLASASCAKASEMIRYDSFK